MTLADIALNAVSRSPVLKQLAREARYAGTAVRCPCCGWQGRTFRPSCHDRPGVPDLCARCMSGPDDRALILLLKGLTDTLPLGARILDVEPTAYTRNWFDRFNQFDYRTMSASAPDVDIEGDLTSVTLTRGICNLLLLGQGVRPDQDIAALSQSVQRLMGDGGLVAVRTGDGSDAVPGPLLVRRLTDGGFTVRENDLSRRLSPEVVARYGLTRSGTFLLATPDRAPAVRAGGHAHHGHG
ncbi:MAG: hypothetical protein IT306_15050 [Chloroflexi bacterium]|nr:hypothetical protein [Chloroflexota bacterium]